MNKVLYVLLYILLISEVLVAKNLNELALSFKNDAIFNEDQDYSAGFELSYKNRNSDFTYHIGQDIYTPKNKKTNMPIFGEHPYAAWLYVGLSRDIYCNLDIENNIKITLGTIGANAKGKSVVNILHKVIGASSEHGWDTQIDQSFSYNINFKSSYPLVSLYDGYSITPYIVTNIGNIFTDIGIGLGVAIPIYNIVKLYSSVDIKYVADNIFLEGEDKDGSTQYAVEKLNQKNIFTIGVETMYLENYTIIVETIFNSKEYKTQSNNNNYSMLKIVRKF